MELDMLREQLGDELFETVNRKLKDTENLRVIDTQEGAWIPRARFDEERRQQKALQEQLTALQGEHEELRKKREAEDRAYREQVAALRGDVKTRDEQIESLSGSVQERDSRIEGLKGDVQTRDGTIEELRAGLLERDGEIRKLNLHGKERELVRRAGARDPELVFRLLDQDRIREEEDGSLSGLSEQLDALKKDSGYLFAREHAPRGGWSMGGGREAEKAEETLSANVNAAIRAAFGR